MAKYATLIRPEIPSLMVDLQSLSVSWPPARQSLVRSCVTCVDAFRRRIPSPSDRFPRSVPPPRAWALNPSGHVHVTVHAVAPRSCRSEHSQTALIIVASLHEPTPLPHGKRCEFSNSAISPDATFLCTGCRRRSSYASPFCC